MNTIKLAACGNNCHSCPRYKATLSDQTDELEKVAQLWYLCGWQDTIVPSGEIKCSGCSSASWCRYGIRECCREKGISTCASCDDYPCIKIDQAFAKTERYRETTYFICDYSTYSELEKAFFRKQLRLSKLKEEKIKHTL